MSAVVLPREIIKWLQSLDLAWSPKSPKWDLTNGYLIAEICSWYYPGEVEMRMYINAASLDTKLNNWAQLRKVFKRTGLDVSSELIEATLHCKPNAASLLLCSLFEQLTNIRLKTVLLSTGELTEDSLTLAGRQAQTSSAPAGRQAQLVSASLGQANIGPASIAYSDHAYQAALPLHCRSTALQAVRNNFSLTELKLQHDVIAINKKAQEIVDQHRADRAKQRIDHPIRFKHRPTLGERAPRRSPPPSRESTTPGPMEGTELPVEEQQPMGGQEPVGGQQEEKEDAIEGQSRRTSAGVLSAQRSTPLIDATA